MGKLAMAGLIVAVLASGCSSPVPSPSFEEFDERTAKREVMAHGEPPSLTTSLFKSDQAILDDQAVHRILSSKVELPASARIALMKFPESWGGGLRYYGLNYWRTEDYRKTRQTYVDTISGRLGDSPRVSQVIPLPTLLTPTEVTIPVLREAAVRLQAELLLVFRVNSDIYYQPRMFAQDHVKAYSTCEVVLLHVRTGVIPFTRVITTEQSATREKADFDINETRRRAEMGAVLASLQIVSDDLVAFLAEVP